METFSQKLHLLHGSKLLDGEGSGNPLLYSCLENPMERGYSPQGHKESDTTEQHKHHTFHGYSIHFYWSQSQQEL